MKAIPYILAIALLCMPVAATAIVNDTTPHPYVGTSCAVHMPQSINAKNGYTFTFCKGGSGATQWTIDIRNSSNHLITTCGQNPTSWIPVPPITKTVTCTSLPIGATRVTITWKVGDSMSMTHSHHLINFNK